MDSTSHPARPFAWLAALSFLVGFVGYLAVSAPVVVKAHDAPQAAARVSGPVSDEWNIERRV